MRQKAHLCCGDTGPLGSTGGVPTGYETVLAGGDGQLGPWDLNTPSTPGLHAWENPSGGPSRGPDGWRKECEGIKRPEGLVSQSSVVLVRYQGEK